MSLLRIEFENIQRTKYQGIELIFETSNVKYIEWLEKKIEIKLIDTTEDTITALQKLGEK